jgi:hypothetical protein
MFYFSGVTRMANWFVVRGGKLNGPFNDSQLKKLAAAGKIGPEDLVRREDRTEACPAAKVKGLFSEPPLENQPAIELPPEPNEPAGNQERNGKWYHQRWAKRAFRTIGVMVVLFGGIKGCVQLGYGRLLTFNNGQLYYTSSVSVEDARRLGNYLVQEQFFDGTPKTVQLRREDGAIEVRMVVKKGVEKDRRFVKLAELLAASLSEDVFGGSQVDIHLCDDSLRTLRVIVSL